MYFVFCILYFVSCILYFGILYLLCIPSSLAIGAALPAQDCHSPALCYIFYLCTLLYILPALLLHFLLLYTFYICLLCCFILCFWLKVVKCKTLYTSIAYIICFWVKVLLLSFFTCVPRHSGTGYILCSWVEVEQHAIEYMLCFLVKVPNTKWHCSSAYIPFLGRRNQKDH